LLALRFFAITLRGNTTPIFGLEIKRGKETQAKIPEADLALFFREDFILSDKIELVFVECKTYNNPFAEKDIDTMTILAEDFPNAFFVFATLEKNLNSKEKKIIGRFIKYLKGKNPKKKVMQVMIITGTELYSEKEPPECLKGKIENIPNSTFPIMNNKLLRLSELSQIVHLS